ncbi:hypothetical protein BC938DRAFT_477979, partial [Jimgerdemannia flammicorona]
MKGGMIFKAKIDLQWLIGYQQCGERTLFYQNKRRFFTDKNTEDNNFETWRSNGKIIRCVEYMWTQYDGRNGSLKKLIETEYTSLQPITKSEEL